MIIVPRIVGRIAYALLVIYLCLMLVGGLFGMIFWSFADGSKVEQFAANFVVGLIGLIGLSHVVRREKEKDNMLDKSP